MARILPLRALTPPTIGLVTQVTHRRSRPGYARTSPVVGPSQMLPELGLPYLLKDGMRGRKRVVSVEEQAVVHPEDAPAFPEVLIEEQQILRNPLQKPEDGAHQAGHRPGPADATEGCLP